MIHQPEALQSPKPEALANAQRFVELWNHTADNFAEMASLWPGIRSEFAHLCAGQTFMGCSNIHQWCERYTRKSYEAVKKAVSRLYIQEAREGHRRIPQTVGNKQPSPGEPESKRDKCPALSEEVPPADVVYLESSEPGWRPVTGLPGVEEKELLEPEIVVPVVSHSCQSCAGLQARVDGLIKIIRGAVGSRDLMECITPRSLREELQGLWDLYVEPKEPPAVC